MQRSHLAAYVSSVDERHHLAEQFPLLLGFSEMVGLVHQQALNWPVEQFCSVKARKMQNKESQKEVKRIG